MPNSKELSSYYKRVLLMLKEVEAETTSPALKKHIRAIKAEMEQEDIAHVEKILREE